MTLTRKTDWRKSCTSASLSTTNSEWKGLWPNQTFRGELSAIDPLDIVTIQRHIYYKRVTYIMYKSI
jgi:hypothetical protein